MDDEAPTHFHLEVAHLEHPSIVVAGRAGSQPTATLRRVPPVGPAATVARVPSPDDGPEAVGGACSPAIAPPGARLAGAVVDGALLQVAGLSLVGAGPAVAAAVSTVTYLAYEVAMVATQGRTLGKLAVGTSVVDGAGGGRPTLWQAATRAVVPLAGVVVDAALGSPGVGAFWVFAVYGSLLLDERRRGLHDRAAGTVVAAVARSTAHRRIGRVAVAAAIVVIAVTLALAADDAGQAPGGTGASAGAAREPTAPA